MLRPIVLAVTVLLLLLAARSPVDAGYPLKILGLFPHPGVSHFHFFHPIMRGLAEAGHDVTVVSPFPEKSPLARYKDLPLTDVNLLSNTVDLKMFETRHFYNHFLEFFLLNDWGRDTCNRTLKSNALAQVLQQRQKFDVILLEQFNSDCMMGVAHVLKAPVIALSSCALMPWHYERVGAPLVPSYIPALFLGQSDQMDFGARLANWISVHGLKFLYNFVSVPTADALVRFKFGHDIPSVAELAKDTAVFFVNQHFALSGAKPLPPSVVELGGIHIQKAKPLDAELQRLLDSADYGVILISWGSMIRANTLPAAKRDGIVKAVRRLKQKVIWKWANDTVPNQPDNMHVSDWLPQRDILCHPNVRVFMTHAGLMGSSEAAYCGVPVIATPMYGDQFLNAAAMERRGMGTILNYEDISENSVFRAIKKVLDKKYLDAAKVVAYSYRNRPQSAMQTAVWWVEYVARTNGAPLSKSTAPHMSRFVYYSLDIYLLLGSVLLFSTLSWVWLFTKLCARKPSVQKAKKN